MTDETYPESCGSLAAGFVPVRDSRCTCHPLPGHGVDLSGKPFCPVHEVHVPWTEAEFAAEQAAKDRALNERALAAALALDDLYWIEDAGQENRFVPPEEIAAIIRPFLSEP